MTEDSGDLTEEGINDFNRWIYDEDLTDYFDSIENYSRIKEDEYEVINLKKSISDDEDFTVTLNVTEQSLEAVYNTDVGFRPLIDVLDKRYPPTRGDRIWSMESTKFRQMDLRNMSDLKNADLDIFQFYREDVPGFDLHWQDRRSYTEGDIDRPFEFSMKIFDGLGISRDRPSIEPIYDISPVMFTEDISAEAAGELLADIVELADYGVKDKSEAKVSDVLDDRSLDGITREIAEQRLEESDKY